MTKTAVLGAFLFLLALISQGVDFTSAHAVGTVVTSAPAPVAQVAPTAEPTLTEVIAADRPVLTQEQESDLAYAAAQPAYEAAQHAPRPMTGAEIDAALEDIPQDHECVLQTADATVYGMVSDTDPQCARWWGTDGRHAPKVAPFDPSSATPQHAAPRKSAGTVLVEDGTRVAPSFDDHVTTSGATQDRCDYLGKQRVTDAVYGHRCV